MLTKEEKYIEQAAILLNQRQAGMWTRDEYIERSNALAMKYKSLIQKRSNKVEYAVKLVQKVKTRAEAMRS